ncbi:MAG: hypothetical protein ACREQZ_04120 [Woeseiaceae bacterium]
MKGIYLSQLPLAAKVYSTLLLVGLGLGFVAAFVQAFTAVGLSYSDVKGSFAPDMPMTQMDHGQMSMEREMDVGELGSSAKVWIRTPLLIQTSHTHLLGLNLIAGLAGLVFLFTSLSEWKKAALLALLFGSIIVDIGGMWLTRFVWPPFAALILIGGTAFAVAYSVVFIVSIYELWLKKEAQA